MKNLNYLNLLFILLFASCQEESFTDELKYNEPTTENEFRDAIVGDYWVTCTWQNYYEDGSKSSLIYTEDGTVIIEKANDGKVQIRSLFDYYSELRNDPSQYNFSYEKGYILEGLSPIDLNFKIPWTVSGDYDNEVYTGSGHFTTFGQLIYDYRIQDKDDLYTKTECSCRGNKK